MCFRMCHYFIFEIKNSWGLIRWDFGHKQRKKKFNGSLFRGRPAPSKFKISHRGKIFWKSTISLKRNEIETLGIKICGMVDFISVTPTETKLFAKNCF